MFRAWEIVTGDVWGFERHTSLPLDWVPFISNLSRSQTGSVLLKLFDVFLEGGGSTDLKEAVCSDTHVEVALTGRAFKLIE